jgi:methyl-accepting chemotaxis protein
MKQIIKRRLFPIVDRSRQYKFLGIMLFYNLIIVAFFALTLFVPDIIQLNDESLSFEVRAAAADKMLALHARVWPGAMALICILGLHWVRAFHRLVGPLHRFRSAFGQISDGDLSFRLKLRKKDYLNREATTFNEMVDVLAEKMKATQQPRLNALKALGNLEKSLTESDSWTETDKELLGTLRQNLEALMDATIVFRLPKDEEVVE